MSILVHFITTDYVKENTLIDTSVDDKIIKYMITRAEDRFLQTVLGTTLFEKLQYNIQYNSITVKQRFLIDNKIIKFLLAAIQFIAMNDVLAKYAENGAYTVTPQNTAQLTPQQVENIQINSEADMHVYEALIDTYIHQNIGDFPEYDSKLDIESKKVRNFGFYLDSENDEKDKFYNERTGWHNFDESL
jgi:hypothetical protein